MPRARLVDPALAMRAAYARRRARRMIRQLRTLSRRVRRHVPGEHGKHLAALLSNGAWAVEELYGMHNKEED